VASAAVDSDFIDFVDPIYRRRRLSTQVSWGRTVIIKTVINTTSASSPPPLSHSHWPTTPAKAGETDHYLCSLRQFSGDCPATHTYNVRIISHRRSVHTKLNAAWEGMVADPSSLMDDLAALSAGEVQEEEEGDGGGGGDDGEGEDEDEGDDDVDAAAADDGDDDDGAAPTGADSSVHIRVCGLEIKSDGVKIMPPMDRQPSWRPRGFSFSPSVAVGEAGEVAPATVRPLPHRHHCHHHRRHHHQYHHHHGVTIVITIIIPIIIPITTTTITIIIIVVVVIIIIIIIIIIVVVSPLRGDGDDDDDDDDMMTMMMTTAGALHRRLVHALHLELPPRFHRHGPAAGRRGQDHRHPRQDPGL
jgi:hypothetical protein